MIDPRVDYSLNVLLDCDSTANVPISYGEERSDADDGLEIHIVASGFLGHGYGTTASLPPLPLKTIEGVPLLFGAPEVVRRGSQLVIYADIIASTYFLVTRYEEWVRRDVRDKHGRFPGKESLAYRAGFIDRPIVDEYGELLRGWAKRIGVHLPAPKRRFSVTVTHDVDHIGTGRGTIRLLRSIASGLLGRRSWGSALQNARIALGLARDPLDNIDDVIELDQRLVDHDRLNRCRVKYFFMAGGGTAFDNTYDIRSSKLRNILRRVSASGAEIGLHASYEAGARPELTATERVTLEESAGLSVRENRHHYLGWREPADGHALAEAGITRDSTMGYADVAGFRLGVCHAIPMFDPESARLLGIEEYPLTVMDVTLSNQDYMHLDEEAAFDCVCRLADTTFRHGGEFVMLWHNNTLASTSETYHPRLYPRILNYLAELCDKDKPGATWS